ncbi:hypothetical protein niasHT_026414 [Heterodera trifolii]|uniref:Glyoxalase/fosfomycin resistance/dioxygenase domain-containing protein n=1 Tax=Heterodera trifolii TaxID=157864 RepID=A0ABD2JBK7_9BILA
MKMANWHFFELLEILPTFWRAWKVWESGQQKGLLLKDPDGHSFFVRGGSAAHPLNKVSLNVTELHESREFWCQLLGMKLAEGTDNGSKKCRLAYDQKQLRALEKKRIHSLLISLDTPGKATVWVVILKDPNEHEICFVGDEGFRELSKVDTEAEKLLLDATNNKKDDI